MFSKKKIMLQVSCFLMQDAYSMTVRNQTDFPYFFIPLAFYPNLGFENACMPVR